METTLHGQKVILDLDAQPGEITMHPDTMAAIENQAIRVTSVEISQWPEEATNAKL